VGASPAISRYRVRRYARCNERVDRTRELLNRSNSDTGLALVELDGLAAETNEKHKRAVRGRAPSGVNATLFVRQ
jgi:hypothetical protein